MDELEASELLQSVVDSGDNRLRGLEEDLDRLDDALDRASSDISGLDQSVSRLEQARSQYGDAMRDELSNSSDQLFTPIESFIDECNARLEAFDSVLDDENEIGTLLADSYNTMIVSIEEQSAMLRNESAQFVETLGESRGKCAENVDSFFGETTSSVEELVSRFEERTEALTATIGAIGDGVASAVREALGGNVVDGLQRINDVWDDVDDALANFDSDTLSKVTELGESLSEIADVVEPIEPLLEPAQDIL